jgi:S1-C subfamily serine protease
MQSLRPRSSWFLTCLLALFALPMATLPASAAEEAAGDQSPPIESSVVKLYVFRSPPDPDSPWQKATVKAVGGSGVIIEGQRILTSAHVVEDYASLEVKRAGQAKRYPAEVAFFGHQCDLAVVTVADERFFKDAVPLEIGDLPQIQSEVDVYGFPVGGETVSVTAGIVSRVEVDTYSHSFEDLLLAQIDAPINSGNSGGPAITDGRIAGIAAQSLEDAENVGYVVPATVITHFLEDIADGSYDGFPSLRVEWQDLESESHRESLGMTEDETGVLATRFDHGGTVSGILEPGDVLLAIDGVPIANDMTIPWPGIGRVDLSELVYSKHVGDRVSLRILRDGKRLTKEVVLRNTPNLVPGRQEHDLPSYLVFGGLVFRPMTIDYLREYEEIPADLKNHALYQNVVTPERRQILVISRVLPNPVNRGYQEMEDFIVDTVNGVVPRDIEHLARILDAAEGRWLRIVTEDRSFVALSLEGARAAQPAILSAFGIARDRSPELGHEGRAEVARASR